MFIEPIDDDPVRKFSKIENYELSQRLQVIIRDVRNIDCKTREYSLDLICEWHRRLFDGIREHAGRYRTLDYGEDRLVFGPNRSVARAEVRSELDQHILLANKLYLQLDDLNKGNITSDFVGDTIKTALYLHAEFIKIHPFRDGNGRVGRLIITFVLCHYDIPPLVIEAPRQEYIDCLNHFFNSNKDIQPLYRLALRIYNNQI
jgi:Fic family protein